MVSDKEYISVGPIYKKLPSGPYIPASITLNKGVTSKAPLPNNAIFVGNKFVGLKSENKISPNPESKLSAPKPL